MKITRKQLRRLIVETMITPSAAVIQQIIEDDDVDERIKAILRTDDEKSINQALNFLSTIYPNKYGTIDTDIEGYTATTDYEREFNRNRAEHMVLADTFEPWLKQNLTDLPDDFVEIFEAAIAYYFDAHAYHHGLYNTVADEKLLDEFFLYTYPLHSMIIVHYLENIMGMIEADDEDLYDHTFDQLQTTLKGVDLKPGVIEALEHLSAEGWIFYDDDNYLIMFHETRKWFKSHNPEYSKY